jgi:WD40 repeat protein
MLQAKLLCLKSQLRINQSGILMAASYQKGKRFQDEVADLYKLLGFRVQQNIEICGKKVDIFATIKVLNFSHRIIVECKTGMTKNESAVIREFKTLGDEARKSNEVDSIEIITSKPWGDKARGLAQNYGISLLSYDEKLSQLIDFEPYLKKIVSSFGERDPSQPDQPPLGKYYVKLMAKMRSKAEPTWQGCLDEYVSDWLKTKGKKRLAIIGEYGTGKTSFCRKLAHDLAETYLSSKEKKGRRIPIWILLGNFPKVQADFEGQIESFMRRYWNISNFNFNAFKKMNEVGLFLLIFDGFDEMAAKVDIDVIRGNLNQIDKLLSSSEAKAILTTRPEFFLTSEEERAVLEPEGLLLDERRKYIRLLLLPFDEPQIKEFLRKLIPLVSGSKHGWKYYYRKISKIRDLPDLSHRPVLLEMIAKTLPKLIKSGFPIDRPNLYRTYLEGELHRQKFEKGRAMILPLQDRWRIMEKIAVYLYVNNVYGLRASEELLPLVQEELNERQKQELESNFRDFLTCSFLTPESNSDLFRFSHRSFMEYLSASALAKEILQKKPSFFGKIRLTGQVLKFLAEMNPPTGTLWSWVDNTRQRASPEMAYIGGNALTILKMMGEPIKRDLSHVDIHGADLHNADLSSVNFQHANLNDCDLTNAVLDYADFQYATLENVRLEYLGPIKLAEMSRDGEIVVCCDDNDNVIVWNLKEDEINPIKVTHDYPLTTLSISGNGRLLATGDSSGIIKLWDLHTRKNILSTVHLGRVQALSFSPTQSLLVGAGNCVINVWGFNLDKQEIVQKMSLGPYRSQCYGNVIFSSDGQIFATGMFDDEIKIFNSKSLRLVKAIAVGDHPYYVAFDKNSKRIICGGSPQSTGIYGRKNLKAFSVKNGQLIASSPEVSGYSHVIKLCFLPNPGLIAAPRQATACVVDLWKIGKEKMFRIATLKDHSGGITSISCDAQGLNVVTGSEDRTLRIWDSRKLACIKELKTSKISCRGTKISWAKGLSEKQIRTLLGNGALTERETWQKYKETI